MARGFVSLLTFLLLASVPGDCQLIPGIGYPGGGYPGGRRRPQNNPQPRPDSNPQNPTFIGILRKIDDKSIVIESDDQTITTISISGSTKYSNEKSGSAKIGDFQPGDHVNIGAKEDSKKAYHAISMMMVRVGTTEEHSTASLATNDISRPISPGSSSGNSSSAASNDRDRPVLHRAAPSSSDVPAPAPDVGGSNGEGPVLRRAAANSGSSDVPAPAPVNSSGDSDRPVLRRPAASSDDTPRAQVSPSDNSTTDRPVLRRSSPTPNPDAVADARPPLSGDESTTVRRMPQRMPVPATDDPFIGQARNAAFSFSETLPNYVVKQYTTRYASGASRRGGSSWQALDSITADVIEEDGVEKYKNILVNGKPPVRDVEKSGSWSRGEFSSLMQDVLSPITNADFRGKRDTTIINRAAVRYEFSVEQPNSHWHVEVESQPIMPAYNGTIWFDKENYRVLRIEMSAQDLPRSYPVDQIEWAIDYDYVAIGEGRYLLPAHSETLSCARSSNQCTRNTIEFRNYRKFTADTSITFDTDK